MSEIQKNKKTCLLCTTKRIHTVHSTPVCVTKNMYSISVRIKIVIVQICGMDQGRMRRGRENSPVLKGKQCRTQNPSIAR